MDIVAAIEQQEHKTCTIISYPTSEAGSEAGGDEADGGRKTPLLSMPKALTQECLVRARVEDPEKQRARAEAVRSKSVHELSQIGGLEDIPVPAFISRAARPVERKKRFREK